MAPSGWWPGGGDDEVEDVAVLELTTPLTEIKLPALAVFPPPATLDCEIYGSTGGYETIGQTVYRAAGGEAGLAGLAPARRATPAARAATSSARVSVARPSSTRSATPSGAWWRRSRLEPGKLVAFAIARRGPEGRRGCRAPGRA